MTTEELSEEINIEMELIESTLQELDVYSQFKAKLNKYLQALMPEEK